MADKRISQLVERVTLLNNDVFPIVASGAATTNKVTLQTIDDYMQTNLNFGVTSVAMTVPTGLSVTGTPITSTGTFIITFTAGYSIPTTAKQTQWDTAYNNRIVSVTAPITFASNVLGITQSGAASDGYLSSTDWNTFNNKQAALTFGNLTEATSSVLTITGGTGAVIGSGTTIQVTQANGSQDGFLDSADWTTFNGKQNALTGTGIVKSTGGTITYLTDNTSNWDSAYNDKINSAAVTGTTTKTLTLTQQDGGTITTTWTDLDTGTVTSVGVSMPSAFSVANSPITSSGTIAITGAGLISQYIDGTGALQTFPSGLPPTGAAGGDLQGTYPNPTVHKIHGIDLQSGTPTANDVWVYGGSPAKWQHQILHSNQVTEDGNLFYTDLRARASISESVTGIDYNSTTGVFSTSAGYGIPTTASQTTWDAAYNDKINSAAVTGTTTKTLTLNQQDGGTITASWTDDNTDAVTSVFGRTGAVVATSGDYNTDQVTEGASNLYFTNARSRSSISLTTTGTSGAATYNSTTGVLNIPSYVGGVTSVNTLTGAVVLTTSNIAEGTNLYYTDTRARAAITLTTTGTSGAATYSGGVLNIPNYAPDLSGYVTLGTTQTISGAKTFTSAVDVKVTGVPAARFFRDLDVGVVGDAGQGIEFGARSGASTFIAGGAIYGALLSGATTGNLIFQTLNGGTLGTRLTISSNGTSVFTGNLSAANLSGTNTGDQTLAGLGGVPTSRTLTINGTAYDLSADRSWTITAGVTSFNTRTGAITLTKGDVQSAVTSTAGDPATNANTFYYGVLYNYYGSAAITNAPENSYGALYALGGDLGTGALSTQIFVGINHGATSGRTRDMYFRSANNLGYENAWRKVWDNTNLTNLNQLTNGPGYITSYTETDTLQSVTNRGSSTSNSITCTGVLYMKDSGPSINENRINAGWNSTGDAIDMWINYEGYLNSNTYYRDFRIGDGRRGAAIMHVDGSDRTVNVAGNIDFAQSYVLRVQNPSMYITALAPSYFGYSTGYGVLIVGQTGANNRTLSFGVDVSGNPSGAFTGHGNEYLWRPAATFLTPNSSNNGYNTLLSWNSSGQMTFNNAATFNSTIYAASTVYVGSDRNYYNRGSARLTNETNNASILDISVGTSATQIYSNYYSGGNDNSITIGTYAYLSNQLRLNNNGRVGIRTSGPDYTFHVGGYMYNEGGIVNGDNTIDKDLGSVSFPHGVSNQAVDILFGDIATGGFIEVTISGTYSYQSSGGGITKCFGVLTNPGGSVYSNETFVRESLGTIRSNFAIGDFQWSAAKGYHIPISHIVSSGNPVYVRLRIFSNQGKAREMFNAVSLGSIYTMSALGVNNVYFINNTGFGGKTNPGYSIHSAGTIYSDADVVAYSDIRVKENIRPIDNVIDRISNSRGVVYDRVDIESKNNIGFIAQELETTFPELVETTQDGLKGVKYQNAVAVLFEAVKMQQKQIEELKNLVNAIAK